MKQLFVLLLGATAIIACNNNKTTQTESAPVTPGIENTNGNLPDTSTTIRLNQSMPVDSSGLRDSTRR